MPEEQQLQQGLGTRKLVSDMIGAVWKGLTKTPEAIGKFITGTAAPWIMEKAAEYSQDPVLIPKDLYKLIRDAFVRPTLRGGLTLGQEIVEKATGKPAEPIVAKGVPIAEELLGEEPIYSITKSPEYQLSQKLLSNVLSKYYGPNAQKYANPTAYLASLGIVGFTTIPFWPEKRILLSKTVLKNLAKITDKEEAFRLMKAELGKFADRIGDDALMKIAEDAARPEINKPSLVYKTINQHLKNLGKTTEKVEVEGAEQLIRDEAKQRLDKEIGERVNEQIAELNKIINVNKRLLKDLESIKVEQTAGFSVRGLISSALDNPQISQAFKDELLKEIGEESNLVYRRLTDKELTNNVLEKIQGKSFIEFIEMGLNPRKNKGFTLEEDTFLKLASALTIEEKVAEGKLPENFLEISRTILEKQAQQGTTMGRAVRLMGIVNYNYRLFQSFQNMLETAGLSLSKDLQNKYQNLFKKLYKAYLENNEEARTLAIHTFNEMKKDFPEMFRPQILSSKFPFVYNEWLSLFRRANMLSGFKTHLRNALSNMVQAYILRPATLAVGSFWDWALFKLGKKEYREIFLSDALTYYQKGIIGGFFKALDGFKEVWRYPGLDTKIDFLSKGDTPDIIRGLQRLVELERFENTAGGLGKLLGWPFRLLEASDRFFSTQIALGTKAYMLKQGAKEEVANKIAYETAERWLFREKLGLGREDMGLLERKLDELGSALLDMRGRHPLLDWALPFLQTPVNIGKFMISFTPAALIGGKNTPEKLAKVSMGSILMALAAKEAFFEDRITAFPPSDPEERTIWYASGKQSLSIRIGDKYIPIWHFGSLGYALGVPAVIKWLWQERKINPDETTLTKLGMATKALLSIVAQQSSLTGLRNLGYLMSEGLDPKLDKQDVYRAIVDFTQQTIPASAFLQNLAKIIDPIYRMPKGVLDQLKAEIPFLSFSAPAYQSVQTTEKGLEQTEARVHPYWSVFLPYNIGQYDPELDVLYKQMVTERREKEMMKKNTMDLIKRDPEMYKQMIEESRLNFEALKAEWYFNEIRKNKDDKAKIEELAKQLEQEDPEIQRKFIDYAKKWQARQEFKSLEIPEPFAYDLKFQSVDYRARVIISWIKEQKKLGGSEDEIAQTLEKLQEVGIITDRVLEEMTKLIQKTKQ